MFVVLSTVLLRPSVQKFVKFLSEMPVVDKFSFDLRRIKKGPFFFDVTRREHLVVMV